MKVREVFVEVRGTSIATELVDRGSESSDEHGVVDVTGIDHRLDVALVIGAEPFELADDHVDDVERKELEALQAPIERL